MRQMIMAAALLLVLPVPAGAVPVPLGTATTPAAAPSPAEPPSVKRGPTGRNNNPAEQNRRRLGVRDQLRCLSRPEHGIFPRKAR